MAMIAAACGKDDKKADTKTKANNKPKAATSADKGGTLVIGAEQEPDCADWIASCAGASWGTFVMGEHTMPRPFDTVNDSEYVPSVLLDGEPKLEEGPPQKITYKINPKAKWSDGQPITSTDFKYTWDQIAKGTDIYDKTGYEMIESVDDSDKSTAVVTFKADQQYAAWKDLFGGFYGLFPSHLLQGKDRDAEMKDGYKWSGGPWVIDHWTKGQEVKLVPNPNWYGKKANLDAVVFKFISDTAAEASAFKTGQVAMLYPQAQPELADLKSQPDTKFDVITSLSYEALWFNVEKRPLDSVKVRQALAYATDRDLIVKQLFGPVQPDIQAINAFTTPANKTFYSEPFKTYKKDLTKVDELMKEDGWAKGGDGIWAKAGKKAEFQISTTAGNKRRETTEEALISQWKEAGFSLKTNNTKAGTLFGEWGPQGVYQIALYAQVPTPDPGLCAVFCGKNIPSAANGNVGQNWTRLKSSAIDDPWIKADTELDESKRADLVADGQKALAEELPGLPLDPFPDVIVYNSAKLDGPIEHNTTYGPFTKLNEVFCKGGKC